MTAVPRGWTPTTLGSLGRYLNGRAFKKHEWAPSGRPIIRIQNLTGTSAVFNHFEGEVEKRYVARPGDLLVSWAATLGAFFWSGPEAVVNQHIFKVESSIDVRFHKHLLDYKLDELVRHTHGSGMVHITRSRFDAVPVAVPHIDEQRRIVDILEDHLARLDAADAYLAKARRRRRGWLRAIEDRCLWHNPGALRPVRELLGEPMRNGHSARATRDGGEGVRTLTLTAVTRHTFTDAFTKITSANPRRVGDLWLRAGDILVQRSNTAELVGTAALYEGPADWAIFPDLLIRLRTDREKVSQHFLASALSSERAHRQMRDKAKGLAGSMPKVDQAAIGATLIPVPDRRVQDRIVAELAEAEAVSSQLDRDLSAAVVESTALRRSLLEAAFSGRLTGHASCVDRVQEPR